MKLLTMCSTCQRPVLLQRMAESYLATSREKDSRLVIYVNIDDPFVDVYREIQSELERSKKIKFTFGPQKTMVQVLNDYSCKEYPDCQFYSEVNDDHVYVTPGWDIYMMDAIDRKNNGVSVAYGKTQLYPTATMHGAKLVHGLGYFFPPEYQHTLVDFWLMKIGFGSKIMTYVPDVLIDHLHPAFNKAPWDTVYDKERVDTTSEGKYQAWLKTKLKDDIGFVESIIEKNKVMDISDLPKINEPITVIMQVRENEALLKTSLQSYLFSGPRPSRLYVFGGSNNSRAAIMKLPESIWINASEGKTFPEMEKIFFDLGASSILMITTACLFKRGWWSVINSTVKNNTAQSFSFFNNGKTQDAQIGLLRDKNGSGAKQEASLFQSLAAGEGKAPDFDVRSISEIIEEGRLKAEILLKFPEDFGPEHPDWKIPSKRNQWLKLHGEYVDRIQ